MTDSTQSIPVPTAAPGLPEEPTIIKMLREREAFKDFDISREDKDIILLYLDDVQSNFQNLRTHAEQQREEIERLREELERARCPDTEADGIVFCGRCGQAT